MVAKEFMVCFKRTAKAVKLTKGHLLLITKSSQKDLRSFKTKEWRKQMMAKTKIHMTNL
jgi:ribosomal protein L30E